MVAALSVTAVVVAPLQAQASASSADATVHPDQWPAVHWPLPREAALEQRVRALMVRMSLEDKVGQLIQADISAVTPEDVRQYHLGSVLAGGNSKPGNRPTATSAQWLALADVFYDASMDTRGGHAAIPVLFGIDAVHGHNNTVGATLFPHNVGLGAAHDPDLVRLIGAATAQEVRATGLNWAFGPTLAVPQDNRWGRSYEGYSSDPALVSSYAGPMVEGLQGTAGTPGFLDGSHVVASAKHFLGDGGTVDGKDQGDARVSEAVLSGVHAAGYRTAIGAGVQSVMASFSSWNGVRMHGNRALLTDVLKQRMDFQGLLVSDWNAHGQLAGCTPTDCPAAFNAGLDMLMAPDSWRGLYDNTLREVKAGTIPAARLDDAVARILRVKIRAGLFDAGKPSSWPLARNARNVIGGAAHRALARRAVRESLVLLKNNGALLPLDPRRRVLLAGSAVDSISRQSGGWTLNWQGTGLTNRDFPGARSIGAAIAAQVRAAGGRVEISAEGAHTVKPDAAVVVFGEDPYAEFQGDLPNLLYRPGDDRDLSLVQRLKAEGIPVVAVYLGGRPLWLNREINAADAFVAAWLPGSEGSGVADVLLRAADGKVAHDFRGTLSYAWPATARAGGPVQFALGYGLTYARATELGVLPAASGIRGEQVSPTLYLDRGRPTRGYSLKLVGADGVAVTAQGASARAADGSLAMSAIDYQAQEAARSLTFGRNGASVAIDAGATLDLDRQANGDVLLVATLRLDALAAASAWIGMNGARIPLASLPPRALGHWIRLGVPLKCFRAQGADLHHVAQPFALGLGAGVSQDGTPGTDRGARVALTGVALGTDVDQVVDCQRQ